MDLIYPHTHGSAMPVHRSLTAEEHHGLEIHYASGTQGREIAELLRHIWYRRLWLTCHCRESEGCTPLLFVRRLADEFVLVRMSDRPPHAPGCLFAQKPARAEAGDRSSPPAALAALLYRWLAAARLNIVFPSLDEDLERSQSQSLRDVARSLELSPGRRLYAFSRTHPAGLPELLRRLREDPPRGGSADLGAVYLRVIPSLTEEHLRSALDCPGLDVTSSVEGLFLEAPLCVPGISQAGGAHVVLWGFGWDAARNRPRSLGAFSHSVYSSRRLVPVDGPHERHTLAALLSLQHRLIHSQDLVTVIRKTLPDNPLYERGIAFQVIRINANGRPVRTFDVVSGPGDFAESEDIPSGRDSGVLFHRAGGHDTARKLADHWLESELRSGLASRPHHADRGDCLVIPAAHAHSPGEFTVW
jgi:hypothetical protein